MSEELQELHAQLHGVFLVMTVMIDLITPAERREMVLRLTMIENDMRAANALAGTIETVRRFRDLAAIEP